MKNAYRNQVLTFGLRDTRGEEITIDSNYDPDCKDPMEFKSL